MKKLFKVILATIKYILIVLISLVSLIILTNFFQLKVLKNDYPNFFGYSVFKVITNSMYPTVKTNDIIIVKLGDDAKKGEVITFKKDGAFITHRVSSVQDNLYMTKGDYNNVGDDEPVLKELVVGKVVKIYENLGIWKDVLQSPPVFILLIVTLLLFNDSFKAWSKDQYYKYKDFRITKDTIIEGKDEKKK